MPVTEEERENEKMRQQKEYDEEFEKLHDKAWNDYTEAIQRWRLEEDDYKHGPLKAYENAKAVADGNHVNKRNKDYPKKPKAPKRPEFEEVVVPNARTRFPLLNHNRLGGRRRTRRVRKSRSTRRR